MTPVRPPAPAPSLEAAVAFLRAAQLNPAFAQAWFNAGNTLTELGQLDQALAAYRQAPALRSEAPYIHWNHALPALLAGDYATGWREFEWRWQRHGLEEDYPRHRQPQWRGDRELSGQTLLLWAEQGFGDSQQFVRYLGAVASRGARVVLEVQAPLVRLLEGFPGVSTLVRRGDPLPPFDLHCPLMSLPLSLGLRPQQVDGAPYLHAPAALAAQWQTRLAAPNQATKRRIGLVWRGNPGHRNDHRRSLPLGELVKLLDAAPPGIDWICLQKALSDDDRAVLAARPNVQVLDTALQDFADSAAVIAALDLVISVDTSVAHLAGAPRQTCLDIAGQGAGLALAIEPRRLALVRLGQVVQAIHGRRLGKCARARRTGGARRSGHRRSSHRGSVICRGLHAKFQHLGLDLQAQLQQTAQVLARPRRWTFAVLERNFGRDRRQFRMVGLAGDRQVMDLAIEGGEFVQVVFKSGHSSYSYQLRRWLLRNAPLDLAVAHIKGYRSPQDGDSASINDRTERSSAGAGKPVYFLPTAVSKVRKVFQAQIADDIDQILDTAVTSFQRGDLARTEDISKSILHRDASHCGALQLLAAVASQQDRHADAVEWLDRALKVAPADPALLTHRGTCLKALGRFEEAVATQRAALALQPYIPEIHYNLGNALNALALRSEAASAFLRATELNPNFAQAWLNAANALTALGQLDRALAAYRRALAIDPNDPDIHWNYALASLLVGDFKVGWQEYELRWRQSDRSENFRPYPQRLCQGGPELAGRTILIWAEQGLGDTLQFIRYLPALAQRGARIILEVQAPLFAFLKGIPWLGNVVRRGDPLPSFDLHCPLLSLPLALSAANDAIDGRPYLQAPASASAFWQARLAAASGQRPRVGFVWRGHPKHLNDKNRSLSIADVLRLITGAPREIDWYCLQQTMTDDDRMALSSCANVHLLDASLNDFSDTAAAMTALDLVITVDTSIAHLAGALGRPVWVLLPFAPDWRWQRERADSPWYDSARLFRQPSVGDWSSVFHRVQQALVERFVAANQV